ncbi:uncharacterized protein EAE97_008456 [Botrytis byssoidea]|uniref:Carotenoid oxygenase n=1 Tax=Botrytis byssoidea TaxID=139641 RepID=A0A9P5IE19_9HELO|nr:uncharacterized protein EAE97_008456 [Botrytis byssoidea]KAF7934096.1 hypothetical protein EAE97_008456 [Botrytis byssoidea]
MAGHYKATPEMFAERASNSDGFKSLPLSPKAFNEPQFSGFMRPVRFEGEINNLEIEGSIPSQIRGTFYRVMPEPQFPNYLPGDPWFNGDGNASAFRIADGHIDLKQRYVRTEKFTREAAARRALAGKESINFPLPPYAMTSYQRSRTLNLFSDSVDISKQRIETPWEYDLVYRNRYTDAVALEIKSTANTNVVYWHGKLLALKEDSPPYAMDPETIETVGLWDFNGQLTSLTFTAHPKFDPITREMVCFGYEAKGDATLDVCYYSIDANGSFNETVWLLAPICGMFHDFGITENYVIFPMIPHICDLDRLKAGGGGGALAMGQRGSNAHRVLPRRGASGSDVKWFRAPHGFAGHVANAPEDENGHIVLSMAYSRKNVFVWWADKNGDAPSPGEAQCDFVSFSIDYKSPDLDLKVSTKMVEEDMEFPRIDDRYVSTSFTKALFNVMDPAAGTDMKVIGPNLGGGHPLYNSIGLYDTKTRKYEKYFAGPHKLCQEPVFIPRDKGAKKCDGFVMALLNNYAEMTSELVILDTADMSKHVALVKLPIRLRTGLHGNCVDSADADGHPSI